MNFTNQLCWLAGFLDADGSIGLFKVLRTSKKPNEYKINCHVAFINNDPNIINEIDKITRKLGIVLHLDTRLKVNKNHATTYVLIAKNFTTCYILLSNLQPYLKGNKKAIASLTLRFLVRRKLGKTREKYTPIEWKIQKMVRNLTKLGVDKQLLPSETTRNTLITSEDIVRTHDESMRIRQKCSNPSN